MQSTSVLGWQRSVEALAGAQLIIRDGPQRRCLPQLNGQAGYQSDPATCGAGTLRWCASAPQLPTMQEDVEEELYGNASRLSAAAPSDVAGSRLSAMVPQDAARSLLSADDAESQFYAMSPINDSRGSRRSFTYAAATYSPPQMRGGPLPLQVVARSTRLAEELTASPLVARGPRRGGRRPEAVPWAHPPHSFQDAKETRSHLMPAFGPHNHVSRPCTYIR